MNNKNGKFNTLTSKDCKGKTRKVYIGRTEAMGEQSRYFIEERTTIWGLDACHHREVSSTPYCEE